MQKLSSVSWTIVSGIGALSIIISQKLKNYLSSISAFYCENHRICCWGEIVGQVYHKTETCQTLLQFTPLFFSSGNQLQSFYFCFYKIFCSTLNSLSQDRIATSSCLHFHFDQVFKMSCSLVTLPTAVVVERLKIGKV